MNRKLNCDMVRLARESRGLTQGELASASRVAQGTISKLELGTKEVGEDTMAKIAETLRYPVSFFYQDERYRGIGISIIFYRKRASTLQKHVRRLLSSVNVRRLHTKALLREVTVETPYDIRQIDITEFPGTPSDVAAMVRASWHLPNGPVRNLVAAIENAGGLVFRFPFGTTDVDAMSQWPDDAPPLFFVNSQAPADRARFSLAHELGHVVMHQDASETMEQEANEFAAALLMPQVDIRPYLLGMTMAKAASMKPYWRVSMGALIKRARDLECISESTYTALFKHYTRLGYRRAEPFPINHEEPQLLERLIDTHMNDGQMGVAEMAGMMHLNVEEFRAEYLRQTPLRLAQ